MTSAIEQMDRYNKPIPVPEIDTFEDAVRLAANAIARLESEAIDPRHADTLFKGIRIFLETLMAREKFSLPGIANREMVGHAVRRVAEKMDAETARKILLERNFGALEDKASTIDADEVKELEERHVEGNLGREIGIERRIESIDPLEGL